MTYPTTATTTAAVATSIDTSSVAFALPYIRGLSIFCEPSCQPADHFLCSLAGRDVPSMHSTPTHAPFLLDPFSVQQSAHLDVPNCQRGMQDSEGEEGAKVLAGQHSIEAHHRDGCCMRGQPPCPLRMQSSARPLSIRASQPHKDTQKLAEGPEQTYSHRTAVLCRERECCCGRGSPASKVPMTMKGAKAM